MRSYRWMTEILAPFLWLWLNWRKLQGKEDPARFRERFGFASRPRPAGTLLWVHAASVGEANSVLLLMEKMRERFPLVQILLTTGTVTSAKLMRQRVPAHVIHQFVPVDVPQATLRFIRHWKPDIALWVESEFWPNLVADADYYQCFMGVINARMSGHSFRRWQKRPALIRDMLKRFNLILAQSEADADRLRQLGARDVLCVGNIKHDAALLPCDEAELVALKNAIGARPVWLAASTHPGEEKLAAAVHASLAAAHPGLLTIIVPRHPKRGAAVAAELKGGRVALRSRQEPIAPDTSFYIADTLGELGLFYRLSEIVFMGGSLVAHGGQNPLEPAKLSCAILAGPHTHNFADIYRDMEARRACLRVADAGSLAATIDGLMNNHETLDTLQANARQWVELHGGATERLIDLLSPLFDLRKKAA